MSSRYTGSGADETPGHPERTGDRDDLDDTRRLAPETDEGEDDEAGYGYGV